jgi:organic radical activating enzyme
MRIDNLILEVTRNCNMQCPHCLRGNAQRVNMSFEIINKALGMFDTIGTLSISGGEPTLADKQLEHIANYMQWHPVFIDNFFMVTNGKTIKSTIFSSLEMIIMRCSDSELSQIEISRDHYHERNVQHARWSKWAEQMSYRFKLSDYFFQDRVNANNKLIDMGRITVGMPIEGKWQGCQIDYTECEGCTYIEGDLYINALGDVLMCCDLSYSAQKKYKIGNILTMSKDDLKHAIENYVKPEIYENI